MRGGARGADGGDDPAARGQDVEIVCALQPHLELVGAVAGPDDVRMRVDKAGHDHAAGGIQRRFVGVGGAQFGGGADRDDLLVADEHGAVFDDAQRAEVASALRAAGEGEELGGGVDEHEKSVISKKRLVSSGGAAFILLF